MDPLHVPIAVLTISEGTNEKKHKRTKIGVGSAVKSKSGLVEENTR